MKVSIILAAGEGTRMKSKKSKVLHKICNKPILDYVIRASLDAGIEKNILIVGDNEDAIKSEIKEESLIFRRQEIGENIPYGTGYAVMQGIDLVEDDSIVLILYGDAPLIRSETIRNLIAYHKENNIDATVLTAIVENTLGYGRIVKDKNGQILKIVEHRDANEEELKIKEVNSGIYVFNGKKLKDSLGKITRDNDQGEYYITDVIKVLKDENHSVGTYQLENPDEIYGINSRAQLAFCDDIMRERINNKYMDAGVTLINPKNIFIEDGVSIGRDTIIYSGSIISGDTSIGEDCIIGENSKIYNSKIGNNVEIYSSQIEESSVDDDSKIGPYSHLRPNSKLGKCVKIGNFVEVKNSNIGHGTKAGHLSYIGDADVGNNVNIGCGVVFVNYDGVNKHRANVGNNAFIGSNSNLVAPITVEEKGYIAAGSTITKKVGQGCLSIARAKQVNIEGWTKRKNI